MDVSLSDGYGSVGQAFGSESCLRDRSQPNVSFIDTKSIFILHKYFCLSLPLRAKQTSSEVMEVDTLFQEKLKTMQRISTIHTGF